MNFGKKRKKGGRIHAGRIEVEMLRKKKLDAELEVEDGELQKEQNNSVRFLSFES